MRGHVLPSSLGATLPASGTSRERIGRRHVLLTYVAAVAGVACRAEWDSNDARFRTEPTLLIDGFMSGQRASDVEEMLRSAGAAVTVLEDSATAGQKSKMRPSLSVRVVSATGFSYLSFQGELRLEFVDDELASTSFHPDNAYRFECEIEKHYPAIASGGTVLLHAATELRADVDYRAHKYWVWEDMNLRRKVNRWIKQYA
jgi:hypothetical protein